MANAIYCNDGLTEETINFNGQSIPLGSFITATDQTPAPDVVNYCFQITGEDEISGTLSATSETYSSCYDCLANNYTIISIGSCDGSIEGSLPITAFGFIPELEQVIYAEINILTINGFSAYTTCFKINEIIQTSEDEYVSVYEPEFSIIEQIIHNNFSIENYIKLNYKLLEYSKSYKEDSYFYIFNQLNIRCSTSPAGYCNLW